MSRHAILPALATALLVLVALPASAHDEDQDVSDSEWVLVGDLVPEEAVPGPGPDPAGAFPVFTVDPEAGRLCYDTFWDQFDPATGMIIRLGFPDTDAAIEIDFEVSTPDEYEVESALTGYALGCIEAEPDLLDFLVHESGASNITVYSADYPQGAAGGFLSLEREPGVESDTFDDEPPVDVTTTVLVTDLIVEMVAPNPPDLAGCGDARLEVTPEFSEVCWEVHWELDQPVTAIHLHTGAAGELESRSDIDFVKEALHFGGEVTAASTTGCISVFDAIDFFAVTGDPEGHYVDVHSEDHPDGALRGQLMWAEEFESTLDDHHPDAQESGRSPVDYILHFLALLALIGVTVFGIYTLRRARGLYDQPPSAAIAVAAIGYALLNVTVLIMLFDRVLAPSGSNVVCSDYDRFATLGLVIALGALVAGGVAVILALRHPPLRQIGVALVVGAAVVAVAWILWVPPEGCAVEGDVEPDGHQPTITEPSALDCEEVVSMHGDPIPEFQGYATPEEAVAKSAVAELGEVQRSIGDDWLVALDGRIVAKVTVSPWKENRYVIFDTEVCPDVEHLLGF